MASLKERAGTYRVILRFHGQQYFVMISQVSHQEAEAKAAQVDYLLMLIKQGLIELPPRRRRKMWRMRNLSPGASRTSGFCRRVIVQSGSRKSTMLITD
jgi:hypothetical protein